MKKLVYIAMALFIVACATKKSSSPTSSTAAKSEPIKPTIIAPSTITEENFKSQDPNFAYADFTKGKMMYETKCSKCHALKPINSQNVEGWNKYVPDMIIKYNRKFPDQLDNRVEQLIIDYLRTEFEQGKR